MKLNQMLNFINHGQNRFQGFKMNPGIWVNIFLILIFIGAFHGTTTLAQSPENPVEADTIKFENPDIKMEANQIIFDSDRNLIEANGRVSFIIRQSGLRLETDQLEYDQNEQVVKIPGQVRLISKAAEFLVNSFTYNLKTLEGRGGTLEGTLIGSREVGVNGEQFEITGSDKKITFTGTTLTRCPKPTPDYVFKASKITVFKDRVSLSNIILYFKGVPFFYLPYVSFKNEENSKFPQIAAEIRYASEEQGMALDYDVTAPVNDTADVLMKGTISQGDDSSFGLGFGSQVGDLTNKLYLINDFQGNWTIEDTVAFDILGIFTTVTGSHEFNTENNKLKWALTKDLSVFSVAADGLYNPIDNENQLGFNVTRKYWAGWFGDWRLGVQARQVSKGAAGGVYGGYQLDYRPNTYLTLGYLRLDSFTDSNYGDIEPNLGSSVLYDARLPINEGFSFSVSGVYNLEPAWKSRAYSLTYDSCCFGVSFRWEDVSQTWSINPVFKF